MKVHLAAICVSLAILFGCTTAYQPKGFTGGYSEVQLDANTYRVNFRGNGFTSRERVDIFLLYRCAELTALRGYDYFILLSEESESRTESYTTPGTFSATTTHTGYTSTTTGQVTPGQTTSFRKYGDVAMIKMFKGDKPADHPAAYNAEELMGFLQQQYSDLKPAPPSN